MRNALLIYDAIDVPRNEWFIAQLQTAAAALGIALHLQRLGEQEVQGEAPVFVLNRSRAASASRGWTSRGVCVYNSADVTEITNDKWRTYEYLHLQHGLPMAQTFRVTAGSALPTELVFPLVQKPLDGHGGAGVRWLPDRAALAHAQMQRPYLLQAPMIPAWDVRIYVLRGEIYAAMLRTSNRDFRSNYSLGGTVQPITPDAQMRALVAAVHAVLPLHFAGVDLLRHPAGGYVIGEVEDAVGCRMLYQHTQLRPAEALIQAAFEDSVR